MNTTKNMAELYNLFSKITGNSEARKLISGIVYNAIADIQDEGIEVTDKELERRINIQINDYLIVLKKTNVA